MTHLWSIPHVQDCLRLWLWCLPLLLNEQVWGYQGGFFALRVSTKRARGGIHCIPVHLGGSLIPMHIRNEQLSSRSPYQNITSSIIYKNMAFPAWAFWENCTVPKKNTGNTVDGRNPAPVEGASFVPLFTRSLHPRRFLGSSEPSTVWINMHNCYNCCIDPIHQ